MSRAVRDYRLGDEGSWLRCRALGFLDTAYYDDVVRAKPPVTGPDLVAATGDGTIVGILAMSGTTIDTVVVHPDYRRQGVGRALISAVRSMSTVFAWTRDDPGTLAWYRAMGFTDDSHYLHIYADAGESSRAGVTVRLGLKPMFTFLHGSLADEEWARSNFQRVHVCRRFVLTRGARSSAESPETAAPEPSATSAP